VVKKLLFVEWLDHTSQSTDGRWIDSEVLDKAGPATCHTVGWVYKEDATSVTLVSTKGVGHDSEYGGDMTILKSTIQQQKILKA